MKSAEILSLTRPLSKAQAEKITSAEMDRAGNVLDEIRKVFDCPYDFSGQGMAFFETGVKEFFDRLYRREICSDDENKACLATTVNYYLKSHFTWIFYDNRCHAELVEKAFQ